jgi:hypothetical protein
MIVSLMLAGAYVIHKAENVSVPDQSGPVNLSIDQ